MIKFDTCKRFAHHDSCKLFSHWEALEPIIREIEELFSIMTQIILEAMVKGQIWHLATN